MRKRFMALALVVSACGDEAPETTHEAGSLLRERGVLRYAVIDEKGRLTVTLFGERGAIGAMEAQLEGDRPIAVQLSLDGAETTFEADDDALWVAVDGSPRERWVADESGWRSEDERNDMRVVGAIELVSLLSAEISGGGPIDAPEELPYGYGVSASCTANGLGNSCDWASACARGAAVSACPNGGYITSVACSCGWWSRYCQARAWCL